VVVAGVAATASALTAEVVGASRLAHAKHRGIPEETTEQKAVVEAEAEAETAVDAAHA
jgi:hypothetical protein